MAGGVRDPLDACTWHVHCAGGGSIRLDDPRAQGGSDLAWADPTRSPSGGASRTMNASSMPVVMTTWSHIRPRPNPNPPHPGHAIAPDDDTKSTHPQWCEAECYVEPSLKRFDNQPPHNASDVPKITRIVERRRIHDLSLLSSDLASRTRRRTGLEELVGVRARPHRNLLSREPDIDEPRLVYDDPIRHRHSRRHRRDVHFHRDRIACATSHHKSKSHQCQTHHHATYPHHSPPRSTETPYKTTIPPTTRFRTRK